jgi:predicted Zn-dependent protease with MMP-like domain
VIAINPEPVIGMPRNADRHRPESPDFPPDQPPAQSGQQRRLLLGLFHGVPKTKKSSFELPTGPDHIVLYQRNIEAVCSNEAQVREQIRRTVIHELGHYFGMDENQLKDV